MNQTTNQAEHPLLLRFFLWIGKPFHWIWLPEDTVQVIYRMSRYAGVRKPNRFGLLRYDDLTETLGPQIYTGGRVKQYDLPGVITSDNLSVTVHLNTLVRYDPESAPDIARVLVKLPETAFPSITETCFRCALQSAVNTYTATQLNQADIREQTAGRIVEIVTGELSFLGFHLVTRPRILGIDLPKTMMERFEQNAQRRETILAGTEFHPTEFRRALVSELIESMGEKGIGDSFLNFKEMLEAYAELPGGAPTRIIDSVPPSTPKPPEVEKSSQKPSPRPKSRLLD